MRAGIVVAVFVLLGNAVSAHPTANNNRMLLLRRDGSQMRPVERGEPKVAPAEVIHATTLQYIAIFACVCIAVLGVVMFYIYFPDESASIASAGMDGARRHEWFAYYFPHEAAVDESDEAHETKAHEILSKCVERRKKEIRKKEEQIQQQRVEGKDVSGAQARLDALKDHLNNLNGQIEAFQEKDVLQRRKSSEDEIEQGLNRIKQVEEELEGLKDQDGVVDETKQKHLETLKNENVKNAALLASTKLLDMLEKLKTSLDEAIMIDVQKRDLLKEEITKNGGEVTHDDDDVLKQKEIDDLNEQIDFESKQREALQAEITGLSAKKDRFKQIEKEFEDQNADNAAPLKKEPEFERQPQDASKQLQERAKAAETELEATKKQLENMRRRNKNQAQKIKEDLEGAKKELQELRDQTVGREMESTELQTSGDLIQRIKLLENHLKAYTQEEEEHKENSLLTQGEEDQEEGGLRLSDQVD